MALPEVGAGIEDHGQAGEVPRVREVSLQPQGAKDANRQGGEEGVTGAER